MQSVHGRFISNNQHISYFLCFNAIYLIMPTADYKSQSTQQSEDTHTLNNELVYANHDCVVYVL